MVKSPDSLVNPRKRPAPAPVNADADWSERRRAELRASLLDWYRRAARPMPWRETRDAYAILVSEMMLQQTQVVTVTPYYERFLGRFPTVAALASADEAEVLAAWAGLGYYRRARLLHAAARAVMEEYGGDFPRTAAGLRRLPGVGPYTAGAVASFAFDAREALVDANVARVLARLFALKDPLNRGEVQRKLWRLAESLLPSGSAREHNNALMELGALVCTPVSPACGLCPVQGHCAALDQGATASIPVPATKPKIVSVHFAGAIVRCGRRYLVRQVPAGEWHAGMWEFPKVRLKEDCEEESLRSVQEMLAETSAVIAPLPPTTIRYTVTHHRIVLKLWSATVGRTGPAPKGHKWAFLEEIRTLPLGAPQKRIVKMLGNNALFAVEP